MMQSHHLQACLVGLCLQGGGVAEEVPGAADAVERNGDEEPAPEPGVRFSPDHVVVNCFCISLQPCLEAVVTLAALTALHAVAVTAAVLVLQSPRYDRPREQTLGRGHT